MIFIKNAFVMKIMDLIKDMFKNFRNKFAEWLGTTFCRSNDEPFSAWIEMHLWHPVDGR